MLRLRMKNVPKARPILTKNGSVLKSDKIKIVLQADRSLCRTKLPDFLESK